MNCFKCQISRGGSLDAELAYRSRLAAHAFQRLSYPVWQRRCISLPSKLRMRSLEAPS